MNPPFIFLLGFLLTTLSINSCAKNKKLEMESSLLIKDNNIDFNATASFSNPPLPDMQPGYDIKIAFYTDANDLRIDSLFIGKKKTYFRLFQPNQKKVSDQKYYIVSAFIEGMTIDSITKGTLYYKHNKEMILSDFNIVRNKKNKYQTPN